MTYFNRLLAAEKKGKVSLLHSNEIKWSNNKEIVEIIRVKPEEVDQKKKAQSITNILHDAHRKRPKRPTSISM